MDSIEEEVLTVRGLVGIGGDIGAGEVEGGQERASDVLSFREGGVVAEDHAEGISGEGVIRDD